MTFSLVNRLLLVFCFTFSTIFLVKSQQKNSSLCHVYDKDLNPIAGVNIIIDNSEKIYVSDKNGEVKINFENDKPKTVLAFKEGLELASWSMRKSKTEIIMRKSKYKLVFGEVDLLGGKPAIDIEIIFLGEKYSESTYTDEAGKFKMRLPVEADINKNSRFLVDNHQVLQSYFEYKGSFNFKIILKKDATSIIEGKIIKGILRDTLNNRIPNFAINIGKLNYATDKFGSFNAIVPDADNKINIDEFKIKRIDSLGNDRFNIILDTYYSTSDSLSPWYNPPPKIVYRDQIIIEEAIDSTEIDAGINDIVNGILIKDSINVKDSKQLNETLQSILAKLKISKNLDEKERNALNTQLELIDAVIQNGKFEQDDQSLAETKAIIDKLRANISAQEEKIALIEEEKRLEAEKFKQRIIIFSGIIITLALLAVIFFVFLKKLRRQKNELERIGGELELKVEEINTQNIKITDSIRYAQTIQDAILPDKELIQEALSNLFILYRPKDIVSGDFYWFAKGYDKEKDRKYTYLAAIDCTGHGVPGAFMSLIGYTILNQIISKGNTFDTAEILESLNTGITTILKQEQHMNDDGMDVCLCRFEYLDEKHITLTFTGAKRPLYIVEKKNGQLQYLKGNNKSIGGYQKKGRRFSSENIYLQRGDLIYLSTDGMVDQNNRENKKYGKRKFGDLLSRIYQKPISEQKIIFENELDDHQKDIEQRDDITVIGVEV